MTTVIKGQLEIQHERGVIYFHCDESEINKLNTVTAFRICRLPPIPSVKGRLLDVTHMHGCDWDKKASF